MPILKVVSNLNPTIFTSPVTGKRYLAGGTVHSINGVQVRGIPRVADNVTLADIEWVRPEWWGASPASRLAPKADVQRRFVQGSKGVTYIVSIDPDGRAFACSCPGFGFRRQCKHLNMV